MHPAADASLPTFVRDALARPVDERPVPELGLGDEPAALALAAAMRAFVYATSVEHVVAALARLVVTLGGGLVTDAQQVDALPVDLGFGTCAQLVATAEPLSVARMRLEQLLPRAVEDARAMVARIRHEHELSAAAHSDDLTGLLSRRQLLRSLATATTGDVVVLIDVDGLTGVNDRYGRDCGDAVLAALGAAIGGAVRAGDVVGRYGGDEIVLLLRALPVDAAQRRVDDIRDRWGRARPVPVTLCAGTAVVGDDGWAAALRSADVAMRDDKRARA